MRSSLGRKMAILIILIAIILSGTAIVIGSKIIVMLILTVIVCAVAVVLVDRMVLRPINMILDAAVKYSENKDITKVRSDFGNLDIHTGDEIEALAEALKQMENDINGNISGLMAAAAEMDNVMLSSDVMNELVTRDELTGIRNKTAYDMEMGKLSKKLAEGETAFGLALADLNFLKSIDDTYGHAKADVAIQKLSHMICVTFVHSPVFRIGWGEFAVILQNNDYENVKDLVGAFNAIIDDLSLDASLESWEKVSAAIGYALYDPRRDVSVEDVFKRAEGAMYIRMKEMNSAGG